MVFPVLRKWAAKRIRKTKNALSKMAPEARFFRPVAEQLEHRHLPSTVVPISLANAGPSVTPNGDSALGNVSADGRYAVFYSDAINIVSGQKDTNGALDVFLYDRLSQTTTLVSHASDSMTTTANGRSADGFLNCISADGRFIVYESSATNLVAGEVDINNAYDSFLYDRLTGINYLVSHAASSLTTAADHGGINPAISADGNYVVFEVQSANLYLYERQSGQITLVSHSFSSPTTPGNGSSSHANINADGSRIAFESFATDLISGQVGGPENVFLYSRLSGTNILVSHAVGSTTTASDGQSGTTPNQGISDDGNFVVFLSGGSNLISGQITNTYSNVFLYDASTGTNVLVSHNSSGTNSTMNAPPFFPAISSGGSSIAFSTKATDVIPGQQDANNLDNAFLYDRSTGEIVLVSHAFGSGTTTGNGSSDNGWLSFSADGNFLVYGSAATDLVTGQNDTNGAFDAFLYDKTTGLNSLISHIPGSDTTTGNNDTGVREISSDGRFVVFSSDASDLVPGDLNNHTDVFGTEPFDGPLTATGSFVTSASEQTPFTATIATFTDPDPSTPEYFKATINWGDGAVSAGTVSTNGSGGFNVSGSHTYASEGSYQVLVQIADVGGSTAAANSVVHVSEIGTSITGRTKDSGQIWTGVTTGSSFTTTMWGALNPAVTWVDVVTGDFNGDGETDIAGRDLSTGNWWVAVSNGSSFTNSLWTNWNPKVTWVDVQVGDFNGDGKADIAGRVLQTGEWWVAQSTGSSFTNSLWTTWNPMVTRVDVKVGDFNGDGKEDIIGRFLQAGQWFAGISNGSAFANSLWATWSPAVTWVDVQVGDFDGDGKSDITGRVLDSGTWWTGLSTGSSFATSLWGMWNPSVTWVDVKVGDFNGDGKADLVGRWLQTGQWFVAQSTGSSFVNSLWTTWNPNVTWVDVQVGDFNGDGKSDITGRVLESGQWWTGLSTGSAFTNSLWTSWSTAVTWVDVRTGDFA